MEHAPLNPIEEKLVKSDGGGLPKNMIAVAVQVDADGICRHSGLVIGVKGKYELFHYTGKEVKLEPLPIGEWYLHKELEILNADESVGFLHHCQMILDSANPQYGFVFDGSYYNAQGHYVSTNPFGEYTTCVGFCINTITGFLFNVERYFQVEDWGAENLPDWYFDAFMAKNSHLNREQVQPHIRRITPAEYTTSAYLEQLPIRKEKVDELIEDVKAAIVAKRN